MDGQGIFQRLHGTLVIAFVRQGLSELVAGEIGRAVERIAQCALKFGNRLRPAILVGQDLAEISMGFGIVFIDFDRFPEFGFRL
jgi:hypothetical protein